MEDILLFLGEGIEELGGNSEVLGEYGFGCTRHIVGQEEGRVFREISIVKDEKELYALLAGTLDAVGVASGEIP